MHKPIPFVFSDQLLLANQISVKFTPTAISATIWYRKSSQFVKKKAKTFWMERLLCDKRFLYDLFSKELFEIPTNPCCWKHERGGPKTWPAPAGVL